MPARFDRTVSKTANARRLRREMTPPEAMLWKRLSHGQLDGLSFRKQHPVGPYTLDFYCAELKLAVELDGDSHGDPAKDARRDAFLAERGVHTLRIANTDFLADQLAAVDRIHARAAELRQAKEVAVTPYSGSPPAPPFQGGEATGAALNFPPLEKGGSGGGSNPSPPAKHSPYTPADFAAEFDVSRETMDRLEAYDRALLAAQMNLISKNTVADRWARHYRDSAQLFALLPPGARRLVDLGSGAGFPGLVLAALGREAGLTATLVESIGKKAGFLRETAALMGLDTVAVVPQRIESTTFSPPDVITARALASLVKLCAYAHGIKGENTVCIFPKGQDVGDELTEAAKYWHMDVEQRPSVTNPDAAILIVRNLRPKAPSKAAGRPAKARK